jgi:methyl-accepting chemotaxis protein
VLSIGAIMVVGALGAAWVSTANYRVASDSRVAARLLVTAAAQADAGVKAYAAGGAVKLHAAASTGSAINSAFTELANNQNPLAQGLRDVTVPAATAWSSFGSALSDIWMSASAASELSAGVSAAAGNFAQLAKSLEPTSYRKEFESAVRLYSYAESGFGVASVPRVDYDLRVLAAGLPATEFRSSAAFVEPLVAASKIAAGKAPTKDQVARVGETAGAAKAAGDALGAAATQSGAALTWLAIAALLALSGIVLCWVALGRVLADVGRRYHRATQQFRAGEADRDELVSQIRALAQGDLQPIALANAASEYADIAEGVNSVLSQHEDTLTTIRRSAQAASSSQASALTLIEATESSLRDAVQGIDLAVSGLLGASELAQLVRIDAQAASTASQEAKARSSDANRMAQDASSRQDALREGLQETSKGIKRLGERTQEINSVVDIMEVLSTQIGVLALNANLEAERAGEAGAGFRLVAREVQSLARKSEEATTRMAGLVKGAQSDARSAAEAVERSTAQVVSGSNINAVSQAFIGTLAPLSGGVHAMTRSISDASKDSEDALSRAMGGLQGVLVAARDALRRAADVRQPMAEVKSQLEVVGAAQ